MNEKTNTVSDANMLVIKMGTIFSIGFASLMLIRAGYKMGVTQSRRMTRKCNKEYRQLEKMKKKILKERKRQEKENLAVAPTKRRRRIS